MSTPTPTPWKLTNGIDIWPDDDDMEGTRHIAMCNPLHGYPELKDNLTWDERLANAKFIVHAANCHEQLLASCEALLPIVVDAIMHGMPITKEVAHARNIAVKAIAAAKGGGA